MSGQHAAARSLLGAWRAPDASQDALRRQYLDHLDTHADALSRSCHPDHLTASALVVEAATGRVLLVRHAKAGKWLQNGGHVEPEDPTLPAAALREAVEETGIANLTIDPVPLRLSRHAVPFCGPEQPAHHLDVQFLAVAHAGSVVAVSHGEDPVAWFDPGAVPQPTDADVLALIDAAARRLPRGTPAP